MVKPQRKAGFCGYLSYSYKSLAHQNPEKRDHTWIRVAAHRIS